MTSRSAAIRSATVAIDLVTKWPVRTSAMGTLSSIEILLSHAERGDEMRDLLTFAA